jgi:hypothetical protein
MAMTEHMPLHNAITYRPARNTFTHGTVDGW